ncbi:adenylate/guanylate cyclase domain-containing protein [uncultured Microbacterium sp.]|uniref:adenylate/guanylate cyclase domain-containing protein n=1 Tax=uncultured Microbacterium sp. TaxID=191216 RepID=UPI002608DB34|nr:adenylate/guanylate cyclase domain-containing protein [uncultured Microbacterium sp.]
MSEKIATEDGSSSTRRRARLSHVGLSIQSKLLIMLLGVSLVSSIVVGAIGFINGRDSLHEAAVDQLTTIRSMRAAEVDTAFNGFRLSAALDSRNLSAQTLSRELNAAFDELDETPLTDDQRAELQAYYADTFVPALEESMQTEYSDSAFIPESDAGQYLQLQCTTRVQDFDADYDPQLRANDAGDGTAYSAAADQYGDYFARLVEEDGYEDVLLMNLEGDVVFSAYKGVDLGTNLNTDAYRDTPFAEAYRQVVASNSVSTFTYVDYDYWIPSLGNPTLWTVTAVGNDTEITGVMAFQVSLGAINDVMTGSESWTQQGLGDTGEVYLVGRDGMLRSNSRTLIENPEEYAAAAIAGGTSPRIAERIAEIGGAVLLQPIDTPAVTEAMAGRSGTVTGVDYLGQESVMAYSPLEIEGLDWVIVASIDTSEAFGPVAAFTRTVLLSLLAIMLGVALLSLVLAQVFTRPVHRLVQAVRRVAEGDLDVQVPQGARDEFGDLGKAFNDMASSLRIKQDLIEEQQRENEKLLHTLMPQSVAAKYKQGDEVITELHEDVSVVFAELVGFGDYAAKLTAEEEIGQLNTLMRGFDEAAEKCGVEKVRTLHGGYLASSGLVVPPRVDNVRRTVDFAQALVDVVGRFNAQNGTSIAVRAGVDTGSVSSGLVARTSLAYDLWGDAVNFAYRVRSVTGDPGIYVSQAVRDRTGDLISYVEAGTVEAGTGRETVWKVA